jgi:hypothetical protein
VLNNMLNNNGKPVYNQAGEQSVQVLGNILDTALKQEERH